ncbi:cupin domain-containing protein [Streptomyces sp. MZ04]|uniref:cupin domain-containing protein n=1 Tax=Streptomyces sp. MZ04 TaxID=2559236 RepID=UPI00107E7AAE|nr:cupin domain-containing protein [Streptomyces sp. MZ04]TGB00987.1 cupin domain-containing protein [Streptomyces sp. MZ04]
MDKGCVVVRGGSYDGSQVGTFAAGISAQSAGAERLCLHRLRLPPMTRGRPHVHSGHESAIFIASGEVEVWHGPDLTERVVLTAGDYIYISPDTPHLPVNRSDQDMIALVARTDPDEQEGVRLLDMPEHLRGSVGTVPVAAPS